MCFLANSSDFHVSASYLLGAAGGSFLLGYEPNELIDTSDTAAAQAAAADSAGRGSTIVFEG